MPTSSSTKNKHTSLSISKMAPSQDENARAAQLRKEIMDSFTTTRQYVQTRDEQVIERRNILHILDADIKSIQSQ